MPEKKETCGVDYERKEIIISNTLVTADIWEHKLKNRHFDGLSEKSHCCILVFDVRKKKSLDGLDKCRDYILKRLSAHRALSYPFVLVGNAIDSYHREVIFHSNSHHFIITLNLSQVSREEAIEWSKSRGDIPYFETSAETGENVSIAFECAIHSAMLHCND